MGGVVTSCDEQHEEPLSQLSVDPWKENLVHAGSFHSNDDCVGFHTSFCEVEVFNC